MTVSTRKTGGVLGSCVLQTMSAVQEPFSECEERRLEKPSLLTGEDQNIMPFPSPIFKLGTRL